ncbi:hypothetical protein [Chryseobacterium indoltheticum]|jgi:hypothetical protein|uniref:hypothetical protein n=1 Tax=Chryseobacterium indoltheticum TaxID=254 RepID=UPI002430CD8E|nr:hypothetical protein [Chryseobacterium indoltheticum]MDF2833138.1 hypothetical protein [Chryseobacterium indoltheticum]
MEKKYFKVGLRPVYYEEKDNESFVFVFDWTNRLFKDDFSYYKNIFSGPHMDDTEEMTEQEFNDYLEKLKKVRGIS